MQINTHFWSYLAQFLLEWEMFQTKVVEKIKTHFVFTNPPSPPPENRAVYVIMWKNTVEQGRPREIIRRTLYN